MEERTEEASPTPILSLHHVSRLCRDVKHSIDFYTKVLGFVLVERTLALDFDGAWLFNYGVGIHLVQSKDEDRLPSDTDHLDLKDNHISFQCEAMEETERRLKEFNTKYIKRTIEDESGTKIDQLFFNDPDGFMVEICNCEDLKLVPAGSVGKIKLPSNHHNPPLDLDNDVDDDNRANPK
ncbi:Glyoxalase/fosfomycin resistance/dioxygenase domain - like 2 [Theobroma cacao]|nr:Glyoxalase/fosfomycin resistance/dioxygenase domain - like 2 [Theobroma cacao]